jgi:CzcA family heavy metal efflux pump
MLRYLVQASLRYRFVVVIAAMAMMLVGVYSVQHTPLDVFPEFAPPLVEVQTEAPGMSSESVEALVTIPIENAVNGVPQMTVLRSKSVQGLSSVVMLFEPGTDLFKVRQMVAERVAEAKHQLPQTVGQPRLMPPLSSTSRVLHIGLTPRQLTKEELARGEKQLDQTDVSVLMKWVIGPRLLAVPGVANVSTYGLHDKQYQVLVKPQVLRDHGLTVEQVKQALKNGVVYAGTGYHVSPNQQIALHYVTRIEREEDLQQVVVAHRKDSTPLLLGQVADIKPGNPLFIGDGVINDKAGLFVVVEKFPWANTLQVTYETEKVMKTLEPSMPGVEVTTRIFRPATFIEQALDNLKIAMIIGCILVALILIAFLFEWRTAVISLTAIPLSIIAALLVLSKLGMTINTMVLAGLAIAVGEVVDDAIIDVENIVRRLQENRRLAQPRSAFRVVLDASLEVRSAVVYASFIVVFVCLPIFFLGGVAGSFFRPLALAYIFAILASLVVALVVTPALCYMLLPGSIDKHRPAPLVRLIRATYGRILPVALNSPVLVYAVLAVLVVGAVVLYPQLKEEYLPEFQENDFLMHWVAKPGTNIDVLRNDIIQVSKEMRQETKVKEFGSHIARAEVGEEVYGPNFSELWISLGDKHVDDYPKARKEIEAVMARHPGFEHDLLTYLQERIKEVLTGTGASVVMRIYGDDLGELRRRANEVQQAIATGPNKEGLVEGVVNLKVEPQVLVPQWQLVIDPRKAADHGLTPRAIVDNLNALVNGVKVAEVHKGQMIFDVVVWGHPRVRGSEPDLKQLPIDLPNGKGTVPLGAVAELRRVSAPNTVRRDKASRCIDVTCNVKGRDLGSVVHDIKQRVDALPPRAGYRIEFLGDYQARAENQRQLLGVSVLAILGIAVLLYVDFRSIRLTLLVLLTLPFALIGGVAAAFATGGVLSLGSLVGFITVIGIAARNGIMLVSHYRHLETAEGVPFGRELVVRGSVERVAPILMTALAAGLGLLPLAISGSKPGYEVEYPMAVVILGGLATSTLLNLLVLPVLYERFGRVPPRTDEGEEPEPAAHNGQAAKDGQAAEPAPAAKFA